MGISNYPGGFKDGVTIKGVPLTLTNPGKVFFVSNADVLLDENQSLAGVDQAGGGTYQKPFRTIDFAIGQCTASRGDVIIVLPGHVEDIASATSLVADIAGVAIIGLGTGTLQPQLNFSATASSVEIDAANVSLVNMNLKADVSAVVVGINVDAAGFTMQDCVMDFNATGDDFVTMIDIDGVNGASLLNNKLIAEDTAGCDEAIRLDDCDNVTISGNHIYGDFSDGAIIGEGAAGVNLTITDNTIYNSDTTAGFVIDLNVAFTGIMANNRCGTLFATAPETALDPGSMLCLENYVCNAVDESGALVPTTVST